MATRFEKLALHYLGLFKLGMMRQLLRYGAQWAGQGAPLARALPAPELVAILARELRSAERG